MNPQIHTHDSLPSTMDEARHLAENGAPEGTVVQALEQTAGRGRFGNAWSSPPGNLYMTTILRPQVNTRLVSQLSFAVALALADTIDRQDLRLKWPNDVLAGGKKIAGILLEMRSGQNTYPDFLLVGTGVNIATGPEGAATMAEAGLSTDVNAVRDEFLRNISHWYDRWQMSGFDDVRAAWLARAHGLGEPITVRLAERTIPGIFEGLDNIGNLMLREGDGPARPINSGAVYFTEQP